MIGRVVGSVQLADDTLNDFCQLVERLFAERK